MSNKAYLDFINEQKDHFNRHLSSDFNQTWNDTYWQVTPAVKSVYINLGDFSYAA